MNFTDLDERKDRYRRLISNPKPGQAAVIVVMPGKKHNDIILPRLDEIDFNDIKQHRKYLRDSIENIRRLNDEREFIQDDYIPGFTPYYGIGVNSAYWSDAKVRFTQNTSWVEPVIYEWEDVDALVLSDNNYWCEKMIESIEIINTIDHEGITVMPAAHLGPLDLANALRGNQLFYDFSDDPDEVKKLLDMCVKTTVRYEAMLQNASGIKSDGLVIWGSFVPGPAIMISEDAADLCSQSIYNEFGAPYTQKLLDNYSNSYIHHHAIGKHINPSISGLDNIGIIQISKDPNCPPPGQELKSLFESVGSAPVCFECTPGQIRENIEILKSGRSVIVSAVQNIDEGKKILDYVRKHLEIL